MSRQYLTSDERRRSLDVAREALQRGDRGELRRALDGLPTTGAKATALRQQLLHRLGTSQMRLPMGNESETLSDSGFGTCAPAPKSAQPIPAPKLHISGGLCFRFALSGFDSSALFHVQVKGGDAVIVLNADHPAIHEVVVAGPHAHPRSVEVHPAFRRLLLAWARLELQGSGGPHGERLRQMREDIGRLMRDDTS